MEQSLELTKTITLRFVKPSGLMLMVTLLVFLGFGYTVSWVMRSTDRRVALQYSATPDDLPRGWVSNQLPRLQPLIKYQLWPLKAATKTPPKFAGEFPDG